VIIKSAQLCFLLVVQQNAAVIWYQVGVSSAGTVVKSFAEWSLIFSAGEAREITYVLRDY
jgi:hypothetical protein